MCAMSRGHSIHDGGLLLLLQSERAPGASADWTSCECLMSTIASSSSEMVTGTAQVDQVSYLGETASRRVSMDQVCRQLVV
jgi:hypothetical protein